jgi:hypothetical protein
LLILAKYPSDYWFIHADFWEFSHVLLPLLMAVNFRVNLVSASRRVH